MVTPSGSGDQTTLAFLGERRRFPGQQTAGRGSAKPRTHTCLGRTGSGYQAAWIQAKGKLPGDDTPQVKALMPGSTPERRS